MLWRWHKSGGVVKGQNLMVAYTLDRIKRQGINREAKNPKNIIAFQRGPSRCRGRSEGEKSVTLQRLNTKEL
jgi:hypothetical protein